MYDQEKLYDTVEVIVEIAQSHGVSASQVALAWLLGRPAVSSVIVGARTDEQLADNLAAAQLSLGSDDRRRLDEVSAAAGAGEKSFPLRGGFGRGNKVNHTPTKPPPSRGRDKED